MTLTKYYKTTWWVKLRNSLLNDFECKCSICGRRRWALYKRKTKKHKVGDRKKLLRFNIHHKHYDTIGKENRDDLLTLCFFCHDLMHNIERASRLNKNVYGMIYEMMKENTDWSFISSACR